MERDPIRLKDDPSVDPALRADLSAAAGAPPPPMDLGAGAERLDAAIEAAGGIAGAGPWIAGALLAVALGGGGVVWLASGADPESEHEVTAPIAVEATADDPIPAARVEPTAPPAEPEMADVPASVAEPRAPRPPRADPLREEMELIARARAALPTSPRRALALSADAGRRFPNGVLAEERESIAILALDALGREGEAQRRADRFLREHPRGPFSERVRRAMQHR